MMVGGRLENGSIVAYTDDDTLIGKCGSAKKSLYEIEFVQQMWFGILQLPRLLFVLFFAGQAVDLTRPSPLRLTDNLSSTPLTNL